MKLLNHLNPADHKLLGVINDDWPFQFLSEFSRFQHQFYDERINIFYDLELKAYMPIRFLKMKLFSPAQILFPPMRDTIELNVEEQSKFFCKLIKFFGEMGGCERLAQPHPYGILSTYPQRSKFCKFGTYIIDLENQTEAQIFEKFHPKYQKAVTHSEKNRAIVKIGSEVLPDFYKVYEHTMKRAGIHFDTYNYFKTIYDFLGDDRICCAVVYDDGVPVSGIFIIYTKYSAFLTHAGTLGESKLYGAAKFLNFEVMKYLKNKGVKKYDFVGVRLNNNNPQLEGIFRFKKGFGGVLKEGYLWKIDILPMKAKAYYVIQKLKLTKTHLIDIIDQMNHD